MDIRGARRPAEGSPVELHPVNMYALVVRQSHPPTIDNHDVAYREGDVAFANTAKERRREDQRERWRAKV
jgi:hypothetical protein